MRILYISNLRLPTEKAHGLQTMKTIEAFIDQGHEVTLLVPRRRNPITTPVKEFYHLRQLPKVVYVPNYVAVLEPYLHRLYFALQRFLFGVSAYIYGLLSKAEIIYSREITISFLLSISGKKVVYEDHEPKKRFMWMYRLFIRTINKKVIVAENLKKLYEQMAVSPSSYIVAPNGVDISEFEVTSPDKTIWEKKLQLELQKPVVLYVGHFYAWKGVYTLLDASNYINDAHIVLIGGITQDQQKVREYIQKNNLKNVTIHPFVPHNEAIRFIKSADILVLPNTAQEERSNKYTTPIKLFEYMASGVPIIASNLPSFNFYLKDGINAVLCTPDSPRELAQRINDLMSNRALARSLAKQSSIDSRNYTWQSRVKKILAFT